MIRVNRDFYWRVFQHSMRSTQALDEIAEKLCAKLRRMLISGLGAWIWQVPHCDGGDWSKIIARCQRSGIKWLAVKAGENSATPNHQWLDFIAQGGLNATNAAGILVLPWWYSRPSSWRLELGLVANLLKSGVQGAIMDAEEEWQEQPSDAPMFAQQLRQIVGPNFHLGHAPFDYPNYHPGFPYAAFDGICDSVHPQEYWTEHGITPQTMVTAVDPQWAKYAPGKTCPVGVTYGKLTQKEAKTAFNPTDLEFFLNHYADASAPAVSLYSYDAAEPACWAFLESDCAPSEEPTATPTEALSSAQDDESTSPG